MVGVCRTERVLSGKTERRDHGLLVDGDRLVFIDYPGADETYITAINDNGTMVGITIDRTVGFIYRDGHFIRLVCPDGTKAIPHGINNVEAVVGTCLGQSSAGLFCTKTAG
jgi:hypothetical protein